MRSAKLQKDDLNYNRTAWVLNANDRLFQAWATVEMRDNQGQLIPIEKFEEIMPALIDRAVPIHLEHTNQAVGVVKNYEFSVNPKFNKRGLLITGKIYNHFPKDNEAWMGVQNEDLGMVSIGGQSGQTPDGNTQWVAMCEVALTKKGANNGSTIEAVSMAKSDSEYDKERKEHPTLPKEDVKQIVEDHEAKKSDEKCPKCGGKLDVEEDGFRACASCGIAGYPKSINKAMRKTAFPAAIKKQLDDIVKNFDEFTTSDLQGVIMAMAMKDPQLDEDEMLGYVYDHARPGNLMGKSKEGGKMDKGLDYGPLADKIIASAAQKLFGKPVKELNAEQLKQVQEEALNFDKSMKKDARDLEDVIREHLKAGKSNEEIAKLLNINVARVEETDGYLKAKEVKKEGKDYNVEEKVKETNAKLRSAYQNVFAKKDMGKAFAEEDKAEIRKIAVELLADLPLAEAKKAFEEMFGSDADAAMVFKQVKLDLHKDGGNVEETKKAENPVPPVAEEKKEPITEKAAPEAPTAPVPPVATEAPVAPATPEAPAKPEAPDMAKVIEGITATLAKQGESIAKIMEKLSIAEDVKETKPATEAQAEEPKKEAPKEPPKEEAKAEAPAEEKKEEPSEEEKKKDMGKAAVSDMKKSVESPTTPRPPVKDIAFDPTRHDERKEGKIPTVKEILNGAKLDTLDYAKHGFGAL